ncbi:MAG: hypothetical protein ACKVUS_13005 [Saprospiraceae bacterium]
MEFESIEDLLIFLKNYGGNDLLYFDLGIVTPSLAEAVKSLAGLDVSDYFLIIDSFTIRHALNRHGNSAVEKSRGQIAIEVDDFALIPLMISQYDQLAYEFARQKHTLIFQKALPKGCFVFAAEIRIGKRKRICSQSLRILNKKKPTER